MILLENFKTKQNKYYFHVWCNEWWHSMLFDVMTRRFDVMSDDTTLCLMWRHSCLMWLHCIFVWCNECWHARRIVWCDEWKPGPLLDMMSDDTVLCLMQCVMSTLCLIIIMSQLLLDKATFNPFFWYHNTDLEHVIV